MLQAAEADLKALRLISPTGNNAVEKYEQVLQLAHDNPQAEAGLAEVVNRYLSLADEAGNEHDYAKAETYLANAEAILPNHTGQGLR